MGGLVEAGRVRQAVPYGRRRFADYGNAEAKRNLPTDWHVAMRDGDQYRIAARVVARLRLLVRARGPLLRPPAPVDMPNRRSVAAEDDEGACWLFAPTPVRVPGSVRVAVAVVMVVVVMPVCVGMAGGRAVIV